jgi:RNA polymerase sigma-70 factor (ECF subfamily)
VKAYTDEQLIINYLKGDEEALEVLIKRYLKPIYSFTFRFIGSSQEAEDITQEVFVKVWRNFKKI